MNVPDHAGLLRTREGGDQSVAPFELFFDLVFVFAVTQLSHRLADHLTVGHALETLLLLLVVWSAWVTTAWVTNWFDPDRMPVRVMLVAVMLASLFMSVAIPKAFGEDGLMFALAYVAIQVGRAAFAYIALRRSLGPSHPLSRTFQRVLFWHAVAGAMWVAGGLLDGETRYVAWVLAAVVAYGAPAIGYYTPGLGRSRTGEWAVRGGHFAERCRLFVIIALGESLLVTGATFGQVEASVATASALVVAFLGSVALWWIYFHRSAEAARGIISSSEDPRRLARSAYTYFHLPMTAGIICVAASDELAVAHPGEHGKLASIALILGGTALFVGGRNGAVRRRALTLPVGRIRALLLPARGRDRRAGGDGTHWLLGADARAERRGSSGHNRPCGVGDLRLPRTCEPVASAHQVSDNRSLRSDLTTLPLRTLHTRMRLCVGVAVVMPRLVILSPALLVSNVSITATVLHSPVSEGDT